MVLMAGVSLSRMITTPGPPLQGLVCLVVNFQTRWHYGAELALSGEGRG